MEAFVVSALKYKFIKSDILTPDSPTIVKFICGSKDAKLLKMVIPFMFITLLSEKNAAVRIPVFCSP